MLHSRNGNVQEDEMQVERLRVPTLVVIASLVGGVVALGGGLWDDAWHTERGRDSFFIPPHLAIYGGVSLIGLALSAWILRAVRAGGLKATRRHRPLVLASLGVGVTLASAPIDNFWHVAFGRDAVIWSPPHLLGIVGTAGLAVAVLVELAADPRGWRSHARWVSAGAALSAFAFLTVEYDTDVPQFSRFWHLPVLAAASAFALALARRATGAPRAATWTAAAHLGFVGLVSTFLALGAFATPRAPLIIVPAVVLDRAGRDRPVLIRAALYVATLFATYAIAGATVWSNARYAPTDIAVGAAIALPIVAVIFAAVEGSGARLRRAPSLAAAVLLVSLALPAVALAHDPGQGPAAGTTDLGLRAQGRAVRADARVAPGVVARGLVARRAGRTVRAPLRQAGTRVSGRLRLPLDGRWFVYVELERKGRAVESWLPITVGAKPSSARDARRFAYYSERKPRTAAKVIAGIVLYGLVLAFLAKMAWLVRGRPRTAAA